jgi:hypothetical protein
MAKLACFIAGSQCFKTLLAMQPATSHLAMQNHQQ